MYILYLLVINGVLILSLDRLHYSDIIYLIISSGMLYVNANIRILMRELLLKAPFADSQQY